MLTKEEAMKMSDEELVSYSEIIAEEMNRRSKEAQPSKKAGLARKYKRDLRCPKCGVVLWKNGKRKDGVQDYLCPKCRKHYSDTTDTALSHSRLSIHKIKEIIALIMLGCPDWVISYIAEVNEKTAQIWRDRCLDAANEWSRKPKLRNIVFMDEMLFSPSRMKGVSMDDQTADGTYPKDIYVGIAFDSSGYGFCHRYEGHGFPTGEEVLAAFGDRIEPGSVLIHDKAPYHNLLVKRLKLVDGGIKANLMSVEYKKKMKIMNNCCSVLRYSFESHRGIKTEKLQSYANLFLYRWSHQRSYGLHDAVDFMFYRVCGSKKSHVFKQSFNKSSIWDIKSIPD